MNFFERQDRARRISLWLILYFLLGVAIIASLIGAIATLLLGEPPPGGAESPLHLFTANLEVFFLTVGLVVAAIGLASVIRISSLASGGSKVAEMLGGTRVSPDSSDPARRQLLNVVEEVALASGTPMPDVYVLEEEEGINAFAAGYTPNDAAVAVTRGTLETLDREELKGVIAHEFSHVLNGDMRLNIRLMGIVFGLLFLTIAGRLMTRAIWFGGRNRDGQQVAMAIAALGVALLIVGAIGIFFGRLIKAAVSRQREFLADASAVQFTRNPDGISGALKKIALHQQGSRLESSETEEVNHMLIASGFSSMSGLLATHPPLMERIQAIDPQFDPERDMPELSRREEQRQDREARRAEREQAREAEQPASGGGGVSIPGFGNLPGTEGLPEGALLGAILADVSRPDHARQELASALAASLPEELHAAARSEEARRVVFFTLLSGDDEVREQQLRLIAARSGEADRAVVEEWWQRPFGLQATHRLPLLELALPALRHRPRARLVALRETVDELVLADGRIAPFEFALGQLFDAYLRDILHPGAADGGHARLDRDKVAGIQALLSVMARAGHAEGQAAEAAYATGMARLYGEGNPPPYHFPADWSRTLAEALPRLDRLSPANKRRLLEAMLATVSHNGRVNVAEAELLRAFAAGLHVPVPLILPTVDAGSGAADA
ncbi:MAG: M48 family metallopeptidase [Thiohalospira sp.]